MSDSTPTTLYRLFDIEGTLLYVGIAGNPGRRFEQHAKDKPWWSEVDLIDLEHMETRSLAVTEESRVIRQEKPKYNVVHNVSGFGRVPSRDKLVRLVSDHLDGEPLKWGRNHTYRHAVAAAEIAVDVLTPYLFGKQRSTAPAVRSFVSFSCVGCRQPIRDGSGYLTVDHNEIDAVRAAQAEWKDQHGDGLVNMDELLAYPEAARWRPWHAACDPDPDAWRSYTIEIHRLRSLAEIIDWTAHLMEKEWLIDTNWDQVLRSVQGQSVQGVA